MHAIREHRAAPADLAAVMAANASDAGIGNPRLVGLTMAKLTV